MADLLQRSLGLMTSYVGFLTRAQVLRWCCRAWGRSFQAVTAPQAVAKRVSLMLDWVSTFCKSKAMQECVQTLDDLDLASSIFSDRLADTLPNKQVLQC